MFHFKQLIVCAAMYKLTPQYIVAYDQVTLEFSPTALRQTLFHICISTSALY